MKRFRREGRKYVDDDVRQEIATVLRAHRLRQTPRFDELLQELGELYMRERWGVKGDMHLQTRMRDDAMLHAEIERSLRWKAERAAERQEERHEEEARRLRRGVSKRRLPADWRDRVWL